MTEIVCTRCKSPGHVPFTPTPGRPILCGNCHRKARARAEEAPRVPLPPRRRMLSMRRKGHFVYDALEALDDGAEALDVEKRRTFVEMVFARGARQGSAAAIEFLDEKAADGTIPEAHAQTLSGLVRDYSRKQ